MTPRHASQSRPPLTPSRLKRGHKVTASRLPVLASISGHGVHACAGSRGSRAHVCPRLPARVTGVTGVTSPSPDPKGVTGVTPPSLSESRLKRGNGGHGLPVPSPDPKGVTGVTGSQSRVPTRKGSRGSRLPVCPSPNSKGVTGVTGVTGPVCPAPKRGHGVTGSRLPVPSPDSKGVTGSRLPVPSPDPKGAGISFHVSGLCPTFRALDSALSHTARFTQFRRPSSLNPRLLDPASSHQADDEDTSTCAEKRVGGLGEGRDAALLEHTAAQNTASKHSETLH